MRLRTKLAALAVTAGVGLAATGAYAYWTSSGSGTGSVGTGSSSVFAVTSDPSEGDALAPIDALEDGPEQTVDFHVKNNNAGHQIVQTVSASVADADGSAWDGPGDCSAADFSVSVDDATPDTDLASGESYDGVATIRMVNRDADQDDCQSVTEVPLYILAG